MHKILQNHLLCAFVANLKIDTLYALYPESFCGKNLAIRKVFAFSDSDGVDDEDCEKDDRTHYDIGKDEDDDEDDDYVVAVYTLKYLHISYVSPQGDVKNLAKRCLLEHSILIY